LEKSFLGLIRPVAFRLIEIVFDAIVALELIETWTLTGPGRDFLNASTARCLYLVVGFNFGQPKLFIDQGDVRRDDAPIVVSELCCNLAVRQPLRHKS